MLHHRLQLGIGRERLADGGVESREISLRKEQLLLALDRLGADAADACYVGDAPFDIAAGRAAGVATVGVTWGFFPRDAVADADVVIDEVAALEAYLMGAA